MKFEKIDTNREYDYDDILNILVYNNNVLYKKFKKERRAKIIGYVFGTVCYAASAYVYYRITKKEEQPKEVSVADIFDDQDGKPIA